MDRRMGTHHIRGYDMRYYKQIENGYIMAIGTGGGGTEITSAEYDEIMGVIHTKPPATETTDYRMKTDFTWEQYEKETPAEEEELTPEEALNILLGGE